MTQTRQTTILTFLKIAMKALVATIGMMILGVFAEAQPYFVPSEGIAGVAIENTSAEVQYMWIAVPMDTNTAYEELNLVIPPRQTIYHTFREELQYPWIQIKSYDTALVKVTAITHQGKLSLIEGRSESLVSAVFTAESQGTLILANLSPIAQDGIILDSSPRGRKAPLTLNLPKFGVNKVALSVERGDKLRIRAQYPITAIFYPDKGQPVYLRPDRTNTEFQIRPQGAYFEMINYDKDQSFVFFTEDARIIQEARYQIQNPVFRKVLVANIQKGHDETNRNLAAKLKTPWSWSVSHIYGFSDALSITCDGSPAIVEDFLIPWLVSEQNICFWGYRLQRELNPLEVQTGYSPTRVLAP